MGSGSSGLQISITIRSELKNNVSYFKAPSGEGDEEPEEETEGKTATAAATYTGDFRFGTKDGFGKMKYPNGSTFISLILFNSLLFSIYLSCTNFLIRSKFPSFWFIILSWIFTQIFNMFFHVFWTNTKFIKC